MDKDQEFVEMIVKALVDNPDKVIVDRKVDELGVLLTLSVDPSDMGKIIGKEGRTAKAIRTLLRVLGARNNARVNLKIAEPGGGTYTPDEINHELPSTTAAPVTQTSSNSDSVTLNDDTSHRDSMPSENPTSIL
ncbi:KH domain-containing protein [Candidatus Berkelbacteria bacterium]|nr:KH domain-containing protein [Candidatus Berkelbacteria bacterium]